MMPLVLTTVGALILALHLSATEPARLERERVLTADVAATNFFAYRTAVLNYVNANSGATGTIADGSLTWLTGYIRDSRWTNLIQSGTLFVYSTGSVSPDTVKAVFQKGGKSILIGKKSSSGNLVSAYGSDTGIVLPGAIPVGSITVVGN